MINWLQKSLYRLGLLSPIFIFNFILGFIKRRDVSALAMICLFVGIALLVYHLVFIYWVNRKLPDIKFNADTVPDEYDFQLIEITTAYAIPLIQLVDGLQNTNIWMIVGIMVSFLILTIINKTCPSPVYLFLGYHYHTLESNGRKYTVVSKIKNYRSRKKIYKVKRIFEDLLVIVG